MKATFITALLLTGAVAALINGPGIQAAESRTVEARVEERQDQTVALDYLLTLPEGYAAESISTGTGSKKWPLLIFLHGSGERGSDLSLVSIHGPPKFAREGTLPEELKRAFILSPQAPMDEWWSSGPMTEALNLLLERVIQTHPVDTDRIYLTGLSMGAEGVWHWARLRPETFAAIVPICGNGHPFDAEPIGATRLPIWYFHGDRDDAAPLGPSVALMKRIRELGHTGDRARMTVYPNTGHDSWIQAYADPALWRWMFRQQRNRE